MCEDLNIRALLYSFNFFDRVNLPVKSIIADAIIQCFYTHYAIVRCYLKKMWQIVQVGEFGIFVSIGHFFYTAHLHSLYFWFGNYKIATIEKQ
jgi:hypothetical protein